MKNLSTWANQNPKTSISILVLLHIFMGYLYFYTGTWLYLEGYKTPSILPLIATFLFCLAWIFYPLENAQQGIYKPTFFKRKFWQSITMVSVALFFIHGGNHISRAAMASEVVEFSAENMVLDTRANHVLQKKQNRKERRSLKKKLRKRLRANIKKFRQQKSELETGQKALIFFLAILVAIAMAYLVLALSCNLMCSGNETLGWIVLIGGGILIITGLVILGKHLFGKKKIPKSNAEPTKG